VGEGEANAPSNNFSTYESFFFGYLVEEGQIKKLGCEGGRDGVSKLIFLLFLISFLRKLKFLIPMVCFATPLLCLCGNLFRTAVLVTCVLGGGVQFESVPKKTIVEVFMVLLFKSRKTSG
jgi:hypothetical protein